MADEECFGLEVDGEPVHVRGNPDMSQAGRDALANVVRAARERYIEDFGDPTAPCVPTALLTGGPNDGQTLPFASRRWRVVGYRFTGRFTERDGRYLPVFQWGRDGHS